MDFFLVSAFVRPTLYSNTSSGCEMKNGYTVVELIILIGAVIFISTVAFLGGHFIAKFW